MSSRTILAAGLTATLLGLTPVVAQADPPEEVDRSRLVPALNPDFAPWDCKLKNTGPVCTGEWQFQGDWEPTGLPCHVPLYGSFYTLRHSTRFYDHDYLNYDRRVRMVNTDLVGTSPTGEATGVVSTRGRFFEPFAVPGGASTFTIVTIGEILEIRPVDGPALFRAVGTLVEPPGEMGTFTGHVTADGVTTRYDDAPLDAVLPGEAFLAYVCRAATGG